MNKILTQKRCSKCGELKSIDQYQKDKTRSDGLSYICKLCSKDKSKNYYTGNRLVVLIKQNIFRQNNREHYLENLRKWQENNRAKVREWNRKWGEKNKEKVSEKSKKWVLENRERVRDNQRNWTRNNKDKRMISAEKRRASKSKGFVSHEEWVEIKNMYGNTCLCCGKNDVVLTMDHVIPLSKGGEHNISNIQPLCGICNSKKNTKVIDYRCSDKIRKDNL